MRNVATLLLATVALVPAWAGTAEADEPAELAVTARQELGPVRIKIHFVDRWGGMAITSKGCVLFFYATPKGRLVYRLSVDGRTFAAPAPVARNVPGFNCVTRYWCELDRGGLLLTNRIDVKVAAALDPRIIAGIRTGPTMEYCAEYDRANGFLNELTAAAAGWLSDRGHAAEAIPATSHSVGPPGFRAAFQHKTAATLAGHGWIGKCALLITETHGSALRLSTVLTDAPLPVGEPLTESRCGDCEACKTVCPGEAVSGEHWRLGMQREEFWSPAACQEGMRTVSAGRLKDAQICGMCIAACPWTLRYLTRENAL